MRLLKWIWNRICAFFTWYPRLYRGRKWYVKICIAICSFISFVIILLGLVDINFLGLFGGSPGFYSIMNPPSNEASEIYSANNELIGKFYNENRSPVKYEDVSPVFWKALIDTEDERYFRHNGVDFFGLVGAAKDAIFNHARGASTITQQLAKNMFHVRSKYSTGLLGKIPGMSMLIIKCKEWIIATKLELVYNKEEILTMYANTVDFSSNAYGIKTACKTYFDTTPAQLTTEQAALLVGMLKGITYYNPVTNPENCLQRRNVVLNNMVTHGDLTRAECDSLCALPLGLKYKPQSVYDGKAAYFRGAVANYLATWCRDNGYDLYNSGLKIYTTLDTKMQEYAEQAVLQQMRSIQKSFDEHWAGQGDPWRDENGKVIPQFIENIAKKLPEYKSLEERFPNDPDSVKYYLNRPHKVKLFSYNGPIERNISTLDSIRYMVKIMHSGFMAMEPQTGEVKAWVGDVDFDTWKYDKVTAHRQPGSTFKLFVYTEAMNQGIIPCDKRRDEPITVPVYYKNNEVVDWKPTNASGTFSGDSITLMMAFAKSLNSIAVRLSTEVGLRHIIRTAHDMGVSSKLSEHPSTALGASDVTLYELVTAYCTIANGGKRPKPILVTRIEDRDGNEIYNIEDKEQPRALPFKTAYMMQRMLMYGVEAGTSRSLNNYVGSYFDTDIGGKTGTTNNNSDGWFMGVTPRLVVGAWVGGEYRSIHFRTGALGQGARTALPICGRFLQSVLNDKKYAKYRCRFAVPNGEDVNISDYDCSQHYAPHIDVPVDTLGFYYDDDMDGYYGEPVVDEFGNPIEQPQHPYDDESDEYDHYSTVPERTEPEDEIHFNY